MEKYANLKPWFGLGSKIVPEMERKEILIASRANWKIDAVPMVGRYRGHIIETDHVALVRSDTTKVIEVVSTSWRPVQNETLLETILEYQKNGLLRIEAGGVFNEGQEVWFLCATDLTVKVGSDVVRGYLLVVNPHRYGYAPSARLLLMSEDNSALSVRLDNPRQGIDQKSHRQSFDIENMQTNVDAMHETFDRYAKLMTEAQKTKVDPETYYRALYDIPDGMTDRLAATLDLAKERKAKTAWQAFGVLLTLHNHEFGHGRSTRLYSVWMGGYAKFLDRALRFSVASKLGA